MTFKAQEINVLMRNHLQSSVTVKYYNIPELKAEVMSKTAFGIGIFLKKLLFIK